MDYQAELKAILSDNAALALSTRRLHWASARNRVDAITRTADDKIAAMKQNEAFKHAGRQQHERVAAEIEREEKHKRLLAAAVARHAVEPKVSELQSRVQKFVAACQGDCLLSVPGALDRIDPAAMINLGVLRELRRPHLSRTEPAELARIYKAALQAGDASGLIDLQIIEAIVANTTAATDAQRPAAKELRTLVSGMQEMRVPTELIDVNIALQQAEKAVLHAGLIANAINPDHDPSARRAYDTESAAFAEAVAAEQ